MIVAQYSIALQPYTTGKLTFDAAQFFATSKPIRSFILDKQWSPIVWAGGKRARRNFLHSDVCVLDFDGTMTIQEAIETWCDTRHVIATSRSHTDAQHRFRVCIPWERRITSLDEYEYNMKFQTERFGSDRSGKDGARGFFPCTHIVSENYDREAYAMDVRPLPDGWRRIEKPWDGKKEPLSQYLLAMFRVRVVRELNPSRNVECYRIAKDLFKSGYTPDEIFRIIRTKIVFTPDLTDEVVQRRIASAQKNLREELASGEKRPNNDHQ